jgi:hypothetical protein
MRLISGDAGKYSTKALIKDETTGFKKFNIRTKIEEINSNETVSGKSYIVEYGGKRYILGDEANISDFDTSKKKITHKIALYVSIANLLNGYDEVRLVTGCPLCVFLNPELREEYKKYLYEDKSVEIIIDGDKKRFVIGDVVVLPESIGYPYQDTNRYLNGIIGVIDIGGLNTNGAIYEKLKIIKSSVFTINEGGSILHNKIKKALNTTLGLNYQDYEVPFLLDDIAVDKRVREIIDSLIKSQVDRIVDEAKKNNWNIGGLPIVFSGGGSLLLQKEILAKVPKSDVSNNAVWDNVTGFYKIGEVKYGR